MIPSFIKENNNKKLVLFDMDGVVAEYVDGENTKIANEEPNIYLNKRPIHSLIYTAKKLNKMKNVSVGILSSCNYHSQMIEKIEWLKKFMPFLKEELIYIIIWENEKYTKETRCNAKLDLIKSISGFDEIYLIDDKHKIISTTNEILPNCAHHVSEILN